MNKTAPSVNEYMTPMPHTIGPDQRLAVAKKTMQDLRIRHLPVQYGAKLIGILSQSDIELLYSFKDIDTSRALVCDAMADEPYSVHPDTALETVCRKMANDKIGSALVVKEDGKLLGIFTYIDALNAFAEMLRSSPRK